jgi:diaminopimelate decarboxylase
MSDITGAQRSAVQLESDLMRAARQYGTPVYVLDMTTVAAAARQLESVFGGGWLRHYSLKANDLPAITGYLAGRGWSGAVVSTGEWQCARHAGLHNDAVVFEGIGKTDAQLEYAVAEAAGGRPVRWLVVESADELARLAGLAAGYRLGRDGMAALDVLLRLNPAVSPKTRDEFAVGRAASKFGMPEAELRSLAFTSLAGPAIDPGLCLRGVHVHVGSALADAAAWAQAGVSAVRLLAELAERVPAADTVDFGGGFPLPGPGMPGPEDFLDALTGALRKSGLALPPRPAIEPGRFLVGSAGWLVGSVLHSRQPHGDCGAQVVLDAGMTELIRPALYGSLHRLHALPAASAHETQLRETTVEGPICESTDSFGTHPLPLLARGDLVAIEQAGAYGASFTSRYNGRPQPAEVLLWPDGSLQLCDRPLPAAAPRLLPHSLPAELVPAASQAGTAHPVHSG